MGECLINRISTRMVLTLQLLALKGSLQLPFLRKKNPTAVGRWVKGTYLLGEKCASLLVLTRKRLHTQGKTHNAMWKQLYTIE